MRIHRVLLVAVIPFFGIVCQADAVSLTPQQESVLRHFKTSEKSVKDAVWTSQWMLKLGRYDDGSSQDGFAQYACEILADNGLRGRGMSVQIIDIAKLVRTGRWIKLGEAHCR